MSVFSLVLALFLSSSPAKIAWTSPTTHNFGNLLRGQSARHIFYFKNTSNATIVIDNVRTDCGCTASDFDAAPIEAGKTGQINIEYDATRLGFFKKRITVWISGQKKSEKLWIEGVVLASLEGDLEGEKKGFP